MLYLYFSAEANNLWASPITLNISADDGVYLQSVRKTSSTNDESLVNCFETFKFCSLISLPIVESILPSLRLTSKSPNFAKSWIAFPSAESILLPVHKAKSYTPVQHFTRLHRWTNSLPRTQNFKLCIQLKVNFVSFPLSKLQHLAGDKIIDYQFLCYIACIFFSLRR